MGAVSYTHLDVYKRQLIEMSDERKEDSFICQIKKVAKELGLRG